MPLLGFQSSPHLHQCLSSASVWGSSLVHPVLSLHLYTTPCSPHCFLLLKHLPLWPVSVMPPSLPAQSESHLLHKTFSPVFSSVCTHLTHWIKCKTDYHLVLCYQRSLYSKSRTLDTIAPSKGTRDLSDGLIPKSPQTPVPNLNLYIRRNYRMVLRDWRGRSFLKQGSKFPKVYAPSSLTTKLRISI